MKQYIECSFKPLTVEYTKHDLTRFLEDVKDEENSALIEGKTPNNSITSVKVVETVGTYEYYNASYVPDDEQYDNYYYDTVRGVIVHIYSQNNNVFAPPNATDAYLLDIIYSDAPVSVLREVRNMWGDVNLGNDDFVNTVYLNDKLFDMYPRIYLWAKYKGLEENDKLFIQYWW